jgi:hypothetical protein
MKTKESKFFKRLLITWGAINVFSSMLMAAAYSASNINDTLTYAYIASVFLFSYVAIILAIRLTSEKQLQAEEMIELKRRYNEATNTFRRQINNKITEEAIGKIVENVIKQKP